MAKISQLDKTLMLFGLKPENYTEEQKELILEPINSPETYMCDGELSGFEAKENWLNKLMKAGLSPLQRTIILDRLLS